MDEPRETPGNMESSGSHYSPRRRDRKLFFWFDGSGEST